jgi:hypothetical protein
VTINGGGTLTIAGGGPIQFNDATLHVAETANVRIGTPNVASAGQPRTVIQGKGTLAAGSTVTIVSADVNGFFENDGTLIYAGQSPPSGLYEDNRITGFLQNDGTLRMATDASYLSGTLLNSAGAVIDFPQSIANGATLKSGNFGSFTGQAGDNLFINDGAINLRGGTLNVPGSFAQSATGLIATDVVNATIAVGGPATLGGQLTAALPTGLVPPGGFTADVLTAASVTGQFARETFGRIAVHDHADECPPQPAQRCGRSDRRKCRGHAGGRRRPRHAVASAVHRAKPLRPACANRLERCDFPLHRRYARRQ